MNTTVNPAASVNTSTEITAIVERARAAQAAIAHYSQEQVDALVLAVGWSVVNNKEALARAAVDEGGFGNYDSKVLKIRNRVTGMIRDMQGCKTVGVVEELPAQGIVKIAKPVGVIAAPIPTTGPDATPPVNALAALKGRNAIIIAPHPRTAHTSALAVKLMRQGCEQVGAPPDLNQIIDRPSIGKTGELMKQADLVVATGGQAMVTCGVPSTGWPARRLSVSLQAVTSAMRTVAAIAAGTRAATKPATLGASVEADTPSSRACQRCAGAHQLDNALSGTPLASAHALPLNPDARYAITCSRHRSILSRSILTSLRSLTSRTQGSRLRRLCERWVAGTFAEFERRDVALGLGQQVNGQGPARQPQLGRPEDRAADDAALVTTRGALEVQPALAPERTAVPAAARRAGKARGPARFDQRRLARLVAAVSVHKLDHRKARLKLHSVHLHGSPPVAMNPSSILGSSPREPAEVRR